MTLAALRILLAMGSVPDLRCCPDLRAGGPAGVLSCPGLQGVLLLLQVLQQQQFVAVGAPVCQRWCSVGRQGRVVQHRCRLQAAEASRHQRQPGWPHSARRPTAFCSRHRLLLLVEVLKRLLVVLLLVVLLLLALLLLLAALLLAVLLWAALLLGLV